MPKSFFLWLHPKFGEAQYQCTIFQCMKTDVDYIIKKLLSYHITVITIHYSFIFFIFKVTYFVFLNVLLALISCRPAMELGIMHTCMITKVETTLDGIWYGYRYTDLIWLCPSASIMEALCMYNNIMI